MNKFNEYKIVLQPEVIQKKLDLIKKNRKKNIVIIGAGATGSFLANELSKDQKIKSAFNIILIEKKEIVGVPVQCTGLLTRDIEKFENPNNKKYLENIIKKIVVHGPNNTVLEIPTKEYVINRTHFDNYFKNGAIKNGTTFLAPLNLTNIDDEKKIIELIYTKKDSKRITTFELNYDFLIGADGPTSIVRNFINEKNCKNAFRRKKLKQNNFYVARQEVTNINSQYLKKNKITYDEFHVFLDESYDDYFGWIVPENKKNDFRVGIASKKNVAKKFGTYTQKIGLTNQNSKKIVDASGIIPIFDPKQKNFAINKKNESAIILLGDAAGHIKDTTGGGIIPSFNEAIHIKKKISKIINYKKERKHNTTQNSNKKNTSIDEIKLNFSKFNYSQKNKKNLAIHHFLRKILNTFTNNDYNNLIKIAKNKNVIRKLEEINRDNPTKIVTSLIIANPEFLIFTKNLFKRPFTKEK